MSDLVTLLDLYDLALLGDPGDVERLVTHMPEVIAEQDGPVLVPDDMERALRERFNGDYEALLDWLVSIIAASPTARRALFAD